MLNTHINTYEAVQDLKCCTVKPLTRGHRNRQNHRSAEIRSVDLSFSQLYSGTVILHHTEKSYNGQTMGVIPIPTPPIGFTKNSVGFSYEIFWY